MSGSHQGAVGTSAAISAAYGLTPGNLGGTVGAYGYSTVDSNPGSLSPIGTFRGVAFQRIRSASGSEDLLISFGTAGILQTFWRRVVLQQTDGSWRSYLSSAATFNNAVITTWSFGSGSSPIWTATTPAPRGVIFFY